MQFCIIFESKKSPAKKRGNIFSLLKRYSTMNRRTSCCRT